MSQWVGFTGPSMMTFAFHSKNLYPKGGNRIGYQSTSVDKALDLAALELHGPTRNKLYRQAYRLVKEDLPYISLWHPKINWVARKCVEKLTIYPTGSFLGFNSMEERCE
jgi:peptide/nickel transport system substrate-binding protein